MTSPLHFVLHRCLPPVALTLGLLGSTAAEAGTLSFTGQFSTDDALFSTTFLLAQNEVLSVQTFSFAGGQNALGQLIAPGGFAPVLALFANDAGGALVQLARGSSNICGSGSGATDPASGFCWDASFSTALTAGSYTLVLSQDGNEPLGAFASDGYSRSGQPDYTGLSYLGLPGQSFVQVDASQRTGRYAVDLQAASVPEPATAWLALAGLASLAGLSARRRITQTSARNA